jgi:hypothetical protein
MNCAFGAAAMAADGGLYQLDFLAWTEAQASALRSAARATNLPIDWENVAEEIETLGRSERRELASRLGTIIEHLLKLSCSPAGAPRPGWVETVIRTRFEITNILDDSPSLRAEIPAHVARLVPKVARLVVDILEDKGEMTPDLRARLLATSFTSEEVVGDWLPDPPA